MAMNLFLPPLGLAASAGKQIPPLQIGAYKSDYYIIVSIVVCMLVLAFTYPAVYISK